MSLAGKNAGLEDMIKAAKRPAAATSRATTKTATTSAKALVEANASTSQAPPKELTTPTTPQTEEQPEPVVGSVRVRYSHYNQQFKLMDGALQWSDVDEDYCISYVFKGTFRPRLLDASRAYFERDAAGCFAALHDGGAYTLVVEEDEAAEAAATAADPRRAAPFFARDCVTGVNAASSRITAELKTLSVEELAGQSDRYRALKEARDLEDVLYSGT